jgi:hypothetical protein
LVSLAGHDEDDAAGAGSLHEGLVEVTPWLTPPLTGRKPWFLRADGGGVEASFPFLEASSGEPQRCGRCSCVWWWPWRQFLLGVALAHVVCQVLGLVSGRGKAIACWSTPSPGREGKGFPSTATMAVWQTRIQALVVLFSNTGWWRPFRRFFLGASSSGSFGTMLRWCLWWWWSR